MDPTGGHMWPRVAWWVLSIAAIPVAKYVWEKVLESPPYVNEVAKANKEELIRLRSKLSKAGLISPDKGEILFRQFDRIG